MLELTILSFVFLLCLSAIFSGSESAFFSFDPSRFKVVFKDAEKKKPNAVFRIQKWLNQPEETLAAILLGNLAVNVLISSIGAQIFEGFWGDHENSTWLKLFIITIILLIFSELLPKVTALRFAVGWSLFWSSFLAVWFRLSRFISTPVANFARWIATKLNSQSEGLNEIQLRKAISIATKEKLLNSSERNILSRSVSFHYDTAFSSMVPKNKVFSIPASATLREAKKLFIKNQYSLAVVMKDCEVIGFLNARNLVHAIYKNQKSLRNCIQPILFMPQTMSLKKILEIFISRRSEVAALLDESGEFSGIITLKDVFKKITGELGKFNEQNQQNLKQITKLSENLFKVNGEILLDDFNEFFNKLFNCELFSNESETLNGYILEQLDGFPDDSSVIHSDKMIFYNMKVDNYRIVNLLIKVKVQLKEADL